MFNPEKSQFQPPQQENIPPQKEEKVNAENSEKLTAEQIEQEKIANDPTINFLKEQGFEGDPKIKYSIDIITAENTKGERLPGQKTFSNYEDLQQFVRDNPDAIAKKETMEKLGIVPFKIDYDPSVYEWSSKLNQEQDQRLLEAFDRFADETMDVSNFEKPRELMTPEEAKQVISRTENKTLTHLDNPELPQTIGDKDEIAEVVRRMGVDARQFENPEVKTLAGMVEQDLMRLDEHLKGRAPEDLLKADQLLGNYLYRSLSNKLREVLNRTDVSIPWEDKEKILNISSLANKIRDREDIMKTRDLIAQEQSLQRIIEKYESEKSSESQEKIEDKEEKFEAVIPRGWTTLKHGTNILNWGEINPYSSDRIKLEKPLSVISQEEFERDKQAGGQYDTTRNYAEVARRPEGMSDDEYTQKSKPFEMRVLFYKDHARHRTDPEYSQVLDKKTMDQIAKYYFANIQGGRHPLVPKGETLVKIGQTQENGKDVFYFVPESLAETYSSEAGVEIKKSQEAAEQQEKKSPFDKAFASQELVEALNIPTVGYTERKGIAAMIETFRGLYPDSRQLAQRLEEMIKDYQSTIETSAKNKPEKPSEAHRSFAIKRVMEKLSSQESQAIEGFLDKNYQKMGGKGGRLLSAELPFHDFLSFVEKIKS